MNSKKSSVALILCVAAVAVVFAGCGSSNNSTTASNTATKTASSTGATQSSSSATVPAGTVSTASTSLGTVLVGKGGMTLYLFEADKNGKSTCSGECAKDWPPAMAAGSAKVSGDAKQSLVSTVSRSGGGKQLVYNGKPLHFFEGDKAAGDVTGNGVSAFGAEWYALTPAGKSAENSSSSSSSSSSSGSGGY